MASSEALLPEFDQEMTNTRRTLERVPEDKFIWKPHEKSGTMGWLAGHLANIPEWVVYTINQDSLDLAPQGVQCSRAASDRRQDHSSGTLTIRPSARWVAMASSVTLTDLMRASV